MYVRRFALTSQLPHLLFYGPPGTGKTSTILALARDLFGPQLYRSRILELNASDERGIDVIREKVKSFAKITVRESVPDYPCPAFKLIILDEADSLTGDAQTALRRVMEVYSRGTRFCIICNYVSRIIEPLTSRCAKFRFRPVEQTAGIEKLQSIVQMERVQLVDGPATLECLLQIADGDLRRAITLLQSAHRLGQPISSRLLVDLGGVVPRETVQHALDLCFTNDLPKLTAFVQASIIAEAYSAQQFTSQFSELFIADPAISSAKKAMVSLRISQTDHLLNDGADDLLQLLSLLNYCQSMLALGDGPATATARVPAFPLAS